MTPAARVQAAIEILDTILAGKPAEQALTGWARRSRFAGSGDRAAVRDHVFGALRCRRSHAALGGAETGRGLMLGGLRAAGGDPAEIFTGMGHAPAPLTTQEAGAGAPAKDAAERLDLPDWLWPRFRDSLGDAAEPCARALQNRAPVHLRVNARRADPAQAQDSLLSDGIETTPHPAAPMALEITDGARRLRQSQAYRDGLVELQDAASQAVVAGLPLRAGQRVLDYCAGGGGKTLAMGAQADVTLFAHDAAPARMRDLPERAARAGLTVTQLESDTLADHGPFDLVLCDVPCSGSGAWRRAPEGKWRLTEAQLMQLLDTQAAILRDVTPLVAAGGTLAYATCSLLRDENEAQVARFLSETPGWTCDFQRRWSVAQATDGFFAAHLTRA